MADSPTRGATEPVETKWQARSGLARSIRVLAFLAPLVVSLLVLRQIGGFLYRPTGNLGLLIWIAQAAPLGAGISALIERVTRRILPLAMLLNLSMVFPDQAPSRLGMALRAGTVKKLSQRVQDLESGGIGSSQAEAAATALQLVSGLGNHDRLTRGHSERVRAMSDLIAIEMGMPDEDRLMLSWGVLLHDMGKLSVPSEVLNKKGKLTDEEWEVLKNHPAAGLKILQPLASWLGDWILAAADHHERWDGEGYPLGLRGNQISLAGRITAVADAYDVMPSPRTYKNPLSVHADRKEMVDCAGSQFDPAIVRAFLKVSIGKRRSLGPLAWLSDLPVGQIGSAVAQAPTLAATGAVIAVSAVVVAPPPSGPETLAFVSEEDAEVADSTTTMLAPTTTFEAIINGVDGEAAVKLTTTTTSKPITTTSTTSRTAPATTTRRPPTTTTSPAAASTTSTTQVSTTTIAKMTTTTAAPGVAATTTTAKGTTTTTTVPTTTTTVPTTTTTVPTTTTTVPTTTTTVPTTTTTSIGADLTYLYLQNAEIGDTDTQNFKELKEGGPQNGATLPNYDTEVDSLPGLTLLASNGVFGDGELDFTIIQRFGITNGLAGVHLRGATSLTLYAAVADGGLPSTLMIDLSKCDLWRYNCTSLGAKPVVVTSTMSDGFEQLRIDFGALDVDIGLLNSLVIRIMNAGPNTIHTAFDSDLYPSALITVLD